MSPACLLRVSGQQCSQARQLDLVIFGLVRTPDLVYSHLTSGRWLSVLKPQPTHRQGDVRIGGSLLATSTLVPDVPAR